MPQTPKEFLFKSTPKELKPAYERSTSPQAIEKRMAEQLDWEAKRSRLGEPGDIDIGEIDDAVNKNRRLTPRRAITTVALVGVAALSAAGMLSNKETGGLDPEQARVYGVAPSEADNTEQPHIDKNGHVSYGQDSASEK
ncbi:hypothetical protein HY380_01150 [Candidatus Saccharibacteria bacterium]|nr:hypothetical protein [Candidatus Saccharibacteria bacterium]